MRVLLPLVAASWLCATHAGDRAPEPARAPHPITAEHLHLYREVDLLAAIRRAIAARHFAEARALLREHHAQYPSRADDDNLGLTLWLECVEHPAAAPRLRAQRFYDTHVHSMLRRTLRRRCLEQGPVPTGASSVGDST